MKQQQLGDYLYQPDAQEPQRNARNDHLLSNITCTQFILGKFLCLGVYFYKFYAELMHNDIQNENFEENDMCIDNSKFPQPVAILEQLLTHVGVYFQLIQIPSSV